MTKDLVILVNEHDEEVGHMEKMQAHREGLLHRAISVILINSKKEILLQQRALHKYHSPGLWSNTCCSHPYPNESTEAAANRRLSEEMGLSSHLEHRYAFIYKVALEHGLTEHEYDHVFVGYCNQDPTLNSEEVMGYKWMSVDALQTDIAQHPENYTYWFRLLVNKLSHWY